MTKHNAANERVKRAYFAYLKEAKEQSVTTVDVVAKALSRFTSRRYVTQSVTIPRTSAPTGKKKGAFEAAGLAYFNPHSLRDTLVHEGQKRCRTPQEFKAWSQNIGHEKVLTTFRSYGQVADQRMGELIQNLGKPRPSERPDVDAIADAVARKLADARHSA